MTTTSFAVKKFRIVLLGCDGSIVGDNNFRGAVVDTTEWGNSLLNVM